MPLYKFFQNEGEKPAAWGHRLTDPRPNLKGDSDLWTRLFELARGGDDNLLGALLAVRCQGALLEKKARSYVIRPVVDLTGAEGWASQAEYEDFKGKWMEPYRKEIAGLLKALGGSAT